MIDLSSEAVTLLIGLTSFLLILLVVSMLSRPRIFTQYLKHMAGIELSPRDVSRVYRARGPAGVREMFLELIIREDLRNGPAITPDTPPSRELLAPEHRK